MDLVTEYCQGLDPSAVHTAPPFVVATLYGRSNMSLPCLPLHMHGQAILPTFLTSSIYIELCIPTAITMTLLWPYKMFEVLIITINNKSVRLPAILLPPAKSCISILDGERDSSHGESSVASSIQGQNSTTISSLHHSGLAHIKQPVTSTPSATQRQSVYSPTAMPGTSSRNTPGAGGPSTRLAVSSRASGTVVRPTPFTGLEHLPSRIPSPEACMMVTNPLRMTAIENNQWKRQWQWQLQSQVISVLRSMVSGSHSIYQFVHSHMTGLVFATGRLLDLYIMNTRPSMSGSDLETVGDATRCFLNTLAEAPQCHIIETFRNTAI